ncbi:MAG: hypothetical protein ACI9MF_002416 [Gammaproteobacteria bacterium]|jgi:hypothetical protein
MRALIVSIATSLLPFNVQSQELKAAESRPSMSAVRIQAAPMLDGVISGDLAWSDVPASGGFIQSTPDEGQPASQRTEIRVAFTDDTLYIGIICFDDDPSAIVVSDSRRDANLRQSDSLTLILDTFADGQNGFVFGTNPSGLQFDGQMSRESTTRFGNSGNGAGFNVNWDGVWEVKTRTDDSGWSAEFALPFKTLRYAKEDLQSWGLNVQRNIRRRNEIAYWSPLERQFDLYRLFDAGRLLNVEAPSQTNLQFIPYLLQSFEEVGNSGTLSDFEAGFDIKYGLTQSLTLDLTYNTDFAQVEVDEAQVNLGRFNLFFPEKRPFFLENAGQFSVGDGSNIELFFSRRIGISDDGEVIPINYGTRISGKVDRTNVGLLYMQTDDFGSIGADNFLVARVNQELDGRSSIGAMYVTRESTGPLSEPNDENQTFGLDGRWGVGEYGLVSGFVAETDTPGLEGNNRAFSVKGEYINADWNMFLSWTEVEENFNPEVGFLRRSSYRSPSAFVLRSIRLKENRFGIHEVKPHIRYTNFEDFNDFRESSILHFHTPLEWKNGAEFAPAINFTTEGLLEPFEISTGVFVPAGTYDNTEFQFGAFTNQGATFSVSLSGTIGGFYNGDRVSLAPGIRWRHGENFTTQFSWSRNDVDLPTGKFTTNLGRVRLSYTLSEKSSLQALFQYNNVDEVWSTNLRYSWLRTANTGLFVVYNESKGFGSFTGEQPNRSILIKYSHMFDVL